MASLRPLTLSFALLISLSGCAGLINGNPAKLDNRFKANEDSKKALEKVGPTIEGVNEALLKSAEAAEKKGNYTDAANYYVQLLDKEPTNKVYLLGLGDALRKNGAYTPAIRTYERLRKEDDQEYYAKGLEGIGLSLMAQGEYEAAGDRFSQVMELDGKQWRTVNAIGILFTIREMYSEARQYFDEALSLEPNNVSVLNNYALMEALAKDYDASLRRFREAASAAATNANELKRVELNQALVLAIKGDLEGARQLNQKHLKEPQVLNNMGYYSHITKDDKMAKSYLNMALTNSPKYYDKAWKNLNALDKLAGRAGGKAPTKLHADPAPAAPAAPAQ